MKIIAYRRGSMSARAIARELGIRVTTKEKIYRPNQQELINWGCSELDTDISRWVVVNKPEAVALACNKLTSYAHFKEANVPCPLITQSHDEALTWLRDGAIVYGRDLVSSHGGRGITVYNSNSEELHSHLFYTKGFTSRREYRAHIINNKLVLLAQKRMRRGLDANLRIRSHANGWIFATRDVEAAPASVEEASLKAVAALRLDFGAVDIGVKDNGKVCVYEVNTAPGIAGSTVAIYARAFHNAGYL